MFKQLDFKKYDNIIILSSITNPKICQENKNLSNNINVNYTKNLINKYINNNKKIIFFSSDYFFDGNKGNYSENDKPKPINLY